MTKKTVLFTCLQGLAAGLCWTAGFYIAFPVWRYANLPGTVLLAFAAGGASAFLLSLGRQETERPRLASIRSAAGVLSAAVLVFLVWHAHWFTVFFNSLYQGFHVTEAGFAGLFTIVVYVFLSLLSLLLSPLILTIFRDRRTGT